MPGVKSSVGRELKVGSIVRVVAVPPSVLAHGPRPTTRLFKALVGHRFKLRALHRNPVLLELEVSRVAVGVIGGLKHVIYIEPDFVA